METMSEWIVLLICWYWRSSVIRNIRGQISDAIASGVRHSPRHLRSFCGFSCDICKLLLLTDFTLTSPFSMLHRRYHRHLERDDLINDHASAVVFIEGGFIKSSEELTNDLECKPHLREEVGYFGL